MIYTIAHIYMVLLAELLGLFEKKQVAYCNVLETAFS